MKHTMDSIQVQNVGADDRIRTGDLLFTKQEKLRLPDSRNSRNLGSKRGARVTYTQLVPKGEL